jgi:hypothetical protein
MEAFLLLSITILLSIQVDLNRGPAIVFVLHLLLSCAVAAYYHRPWMVGEIGE